MATTNDYRWRDDLPIFTADEQASIFRAVPGTSATLITRVFSKVEVGMHPFGCWEWTGTLDQHGYGVIGRGPRGSGNVPAHCAVYLLLVDDIPPGMQYDHMCRNHPCVNPDHGEIVTPEENKRRGYGVAVLHSLRDTCLYGHPKDGITQLKNGTSLRYCKECARRSSSARYAASRPWPVGSHCMNGHPRAEHTYIGASGIRTCRLCKAAGQVRYRIRKRNERGGSQ